jgi:Fic family protein
MKLNKHASYVLLYLLNGAATAAAISERMPDVDIRSIQRSLVRLTELGLIVRNGTNNPTYSVHYQNLLKAAISDKLLEDEDRPMSAFHHNFIIWLENLSPKDLGLLFGEYAGSAANNKSDMPMSAKELEYLTVELSWKSSALEGNTYTLLDTQLLLLEGIKAKKRTEFETQMILNHKNAIAYIVEYKELFTGKLEFKTVEQLHRIIGDNLGIGVGIRKKLVRITASNYTPLANPHQLRENADIILKIISRAPNPFAKALLALALIPYLQIFEDGNKRTGRMLANALLIHSIGRGFSLRKTDARNLALAYLSFYEFNSLRALSKILQNELV